MLSYAKPYVDDLILPGGSFEQILERAEFVFKRLISAGLKMRGKKTQIGISEVTSYLGFICSERMDRSSKDKGSPEAAISSYGNTSTPLSGLMSSPSAFY